MQASGFVTDVLSLGESKFMGVCILPPAHPYKSPDSVRHYRRIDIRIIPHDQARFHLLFNCFLHGTLNNTYI